MELFLMPSGLMEFSLVLLLLTSLYCTADCSIHKPTEVTGDMFRSLGASLKLFTDFPGGAVVKNPPANEGDTGSSPGPGRSHMPWSN